MPSVNPIGQFVLVLSLVLLSFIIWGDPVDKFSMDYADWRHKNETGHFKNTYTVHAQSLIPTRVHLSHFSRLFQKPQTSEGLCRLMHNGQKKADGSYPCSKANTAAGEQKDWFKTSTYNYITDEVFVNAKDGKSRQYTNISPLHKAMLLSGCYGNYHNIRHPYSALNALEADWFRELVHHNDTTFVMNIMLQHLENTESLTSSRATPPTTATPLNHLAYKVSRDRSVCACMKDFAAPYIVKENTGFELKFSEDQY